MVKQEAEYTKLVPVTATASGTCIEDDDEPQKLTTLQKISQGVEKLHRTVRGSGKYSESSPQQYPLEESTYDAALLAICFLEDVGEEGNTFQEYFQFGFAWLVHFAIAAFQAILVLFLFATVVEEAEDPYEHGLDDKLQTLREAIQSNTVLDKHSDVIRLCRKDHTLEWIHFCVVALWCSRMMKELRSAGQIALAIMHLPVGSPSIESDEGVHDVGPFTIKQMPRWLKAIVLIFVLGIQLIVDSLLTFAAAKYLALSVDMNRLISKAVSMQFVVTLDELFCSAFIPTNFKQKIKQTKIQVGTKPQILEQWTKAIFFTIGSMGLACLFRFGLFENISVFRSVCREYYIHFPHERHMIMDTMKSIEDAYLGLLKNEL